ncbi:Alpha/Beta hydrolase protein [Parachaetomium inaequale]|uniref:Alpha/Beta hydrolase protein n=1 Tax=Parachaetomium inaequale TaxID=2588326 RepID=A0AAN6PD74_9PEZI|nr:Alpha/Beta hydrolase protein [Parachaetomium inaequale]
MRLLTKLALLAFLTITAQADPVPPIPPNHGQPEPQQHRLSPSPNTASHSQPDGSGSSAHGTGVSTPFFASLERTARLVDITYCVGTTGIAPPFSCVSRCSEFPALQLLRTWNTGVLLSDSCGYIAVDHGGGRRRVGEARGRGRGREGEWGGEGDDGIVGEGKEIVVAFRGTYSVTNTIVDLSTVPQEYVPYPAPPGGDGNDDDGDGDGKCDNCTVHMGFMASWRNAREVVIPALKAAREKYPGYRVHLVGHSLGGAVAALAALEVRLGLGWRDVVVTTFGEPRVGNGKLAEYVDRAFGLLAQKDSEDLAYRRVTHVGDPVPLLPLSEWGYRSHAGEVYIGKSDLPPGPADLRLCRGDDDPECMGGAETADWLGWVLGLMKRERTHEVEALELERGWFPARLKLWQLFFAHRDYFWRLGLCLPGGDPADWGREKYNLTLDESRDEIRDL